MSGHEDNPTFRRVAQGIFNFRWFFVILWPLLAVLSLYPAYLVLFRVSGGLKHAPPGTESYAALQVVQDHFTNTAAMRYEKIVVSCRPGDELCKKASNSMSRGIVEELTGILKRFNYTHPGAILQIQSYYTYAAHHADDIMGGNLMASTDEKSLLMQWVWTPGRIKEPNAARNLIFYLQDVIDRMNKMAGPHAMEIKLTGLFTLDVVLKKTLIEEIVMHEIRTIWLPFCILAYALQSPRMLLLALIPMGIELPIGLGIMYFVSLETTVMLYAIEMMLMLMTSLSFDYALFLLTRYAEERRNGEEVETSIVTMISQVGQVVLTSGVVLIISWASMLGLPGLFVSFSLASGTMITICVCVQMTFVPSLLSILPFLGPEKGAVPALDEEAAPSPEVSRKADGSTTGSSPRTRPRAMMKAEPFMKGFKFCVGKYLTAFPINILVPAIIYMTMSPLTKRFLRNFDAAEFRFNMGHLYETQVPRGVQEWSTALQIQKDFPNSMGVLMPMIIIATSQQEAPHPNVTQALAAEGPNALVTSNEELNVRTQHFFDQNCQMINTLIRSTKGTKYPLKGQDFLSLTIKGGENPDGTVDCMDLWKVNVVHENWLVRHVFLQHVSKLFDVGWQSMVSTHNHAMMSMIFPTVDPFGDGAFELARVVRETLRVLSRSSESGTTGEPGVSYLLFSAGTAVMDLINMTAGSLPKAFLSCVLISTCLVAYKFGAIFLPIRSVLTVLIPLSWAYGAALFVFQDGVLAWTGIACISPTGNAGLDWVVPVFTLTFLVGLALDYDVFLFERVKEFRMEGFGDREAIQLGLSANGGTIMCAGAIMAFSFGGSTMLGSLPNMNQMGFVMVFSITVDTFMVRTILVPAMLSLSSCLNYFPTRLPAPKYTWLAEGRDPLAEIEDENEDDEEDDVDTESE